MEKPILPFLLSFGIAACMTWLLQYCLRSGIVGGGPAGPDARRDRQPIRYWIGVTGLTIGTAFLFAYVLFLGWESVA